MFFNIPPLKCNPHIKCNYLQYLKKITIFTLFILFSVFNIINHINISYANQNNKSATSNALFIQFSIKNPISYHKGKLPRGFKISAISTNAIILYEDLTTGTKTEISCSQTKSWVLDSQCTQSSSDLLASFHLNNPPDGFYRLQIIINTEGYFRNRSLLKTDYNILLIDKITGQSLFLSNTSNYKIPLIYGKQPITVGHFIIKNKQTQLK